MLISCVMACIYRQYNKSKIMNIENPHTQEYIIIVVRARVRERENI